MRRAGCTATVDQPHAPAGKLSTLGWASFVTKRTSGRHTLAVHVRRIARSNPEVFKGIIAILSLHQAQKYRSGQKNVLWYNRHISGTHVGNSDLVMSARWESSTSHGIKAVWKRTPGRKSDLGLKATRSGTGT